jgi:hypothetical protein
MSHPATKSAERAVTMFVASYLAIASVLSWRAQNWEFVFYVLVVLILAFFIKAVHSKVQFSTGVLWTLAIWGLLHMLGGLMPIPVTWPHNGDNAVLYSLWLIPDFFKYDHLVHMYGFGICTWVNWQVLRPIVIGTQQYLSEIVLAVLASNGLGAFNEIIEFVAVIVISETNVGGYTNTLWDLVANLAGSIIAAFVIWYGKPFRQSRT